MRLDGHAPRTAGTRTSSPTVNPAQGPIARSACTEKEPEAGFAADISPSIRITSMTSSAGDGVGEHDGRAGRGDARAGADEQPGADHPAEGDHRQMALLEAVRERGVAAVAGRARKSETWAAVSRWTGRTLGMGPVEDVRYTGTMLTQVNIAQCHASQSRSCRTHLARAPRSQPCDSQRIRLRTGHP